MQTLGTHIHVHASNAHNVLAHKIDQSPTVDFILCPPHPSIVKVIHALAAHALSVRTATDRHKQRPRTLILAAHVC